MSSTATRARPTSRPTPPHPLNVYGATKLAGEQAILAACPRALLILRTSWVVSSHGKNFVKTMLRLAGEGKPLKVVDDQFGRPTAARDLARFILSQAERLARRRPATRCSASHHFANAGEVSWKGFAEAIFDLALGAGRARSVAAGATADWPAPAKRPHARHAGHRQARTHLRRHARPWREAVAEIVAELQTEQRGRRHETRHHPGRRLRHPAASPDPGGLQAAAAGLRQADDLLSAVGAAAGRRARDPDHHHAGGPGRLQAAAGRRLAAAA